MIHIPRHLRTIEHGFDVAHHAIEDAAEVALIGHDKEAIAKARNQVKRLQEILEHWTEQTEQLLDQVEEQGAEFDAWGDEGEQS